MKNRKSRHVGKSMAFAVFVLSFASVQAATYTKIEWNGASVTSGVYTNDANWIGGVAPKNGELGYFNNYTGNPDISLDFTPGFAENSTTWMRVPNSTSNSRTVTLDASNGGWWEKSAYDYFSASSLNNVGIIFGDGNSDPNSTTFAMKRTSTTDFSQTLFRMTNAVIRFGGNKTLMNLEFSGGPIDFWNPGGEASPSASTRPEILSGNGSLAPSCITFKDGSSVRTGLWRARANGGDSSIVIEGGTHFFAGWMILDSATANRLAVSIQGGTVTVGDSVTIGATGTLALEGGTLGATALSGSSSGTLTADGGTFAAQASGTTIDGLGEAQLGAKGLVYDSNGYATSINQSFTDSDAETEGLFAKVGAEELTVSTASAHAKTEIRGGSLIFGTDVATFGRQLALAAGTAADVSAAGLSVEKLTLGDGVILDVTAGKPISVTTANGLTIGAGVRINLLNATTAGTFNLFETQTAITAADLAKLTVVNKERGYYHTLSADGNNVRLVTEYHEPKDVVWNGSASGVWTTTDNWNGGSLPLRDDAAIFPASAANKDISVDGDAQVWTLSFPEVATYTLGGTGTVKGDVEVAGGKVTVVSPSVLAGDGTLRLTKGTFVGAAEGLAFARDLAVTNARPVGLMATSDMTITGSVSVTAGELVKLGDATVTVALPEGTHAIAAAGAPAIGKVATTTFDYDRATGEFATAGGLTYFNIVEGGLRLVGAGADRTTVDNPYVTAIGIRGGETSSPVLSLSSLTYNGGLGGSRTVVGTYYTNAVANPPALVLTDGAVLNASEFVVGFQSTSSGSFYVAVTNSTLSASTNLQFPFDNGSNNDSRRAYVTADGADALIEYTATRASDTINGIILGPVDLRLSNGAMLVAGGTRPVRYSDHVRYNASVLVASGATFSAPALLGINTFTRHSGVTNTFDGGTLELTTSATSLFAHPEENVMVVGANGATVSVGEGLTHRIAFPIIGAGAFAKTGAGTLVLGKTLDWVSDDVTNECEAVAWQATGSVQIAVGALDFAGQTFPNLVLKPGSGELRNATLERVRVDLSGLSPEIGDRIPVVTLGTGVTTDLSKWRIAVRASGYSVQFVRENNVVYADIATKRGMVLMVR